MRNNANFKTKNSRGGFTLIETLVSLTLFSIAITIAVVSLIYAFRAQRQITAFISVNNNMSLTIEQMAREMRTGFGFSSASPSEITFTNSSRETVTYLLNGTRIERRAIAPLNPVNFFPVTSNKIVVGHLVFIISNNPSFPPRITIVFGVRPTESSVSSASFDLQTTVSPRTL